MTSQKMFSSEVELGKFLGRINIIADAYEAISKTTSTYQLHTSSSGTQLLAFSCPTTDHTTRFLKREFDLVSSRDYKSVDFICTKRDKPTFSITKAAVEWFDNLSDDLKELAKKLIKSPLVVTGQGIRGYHAILFTLWLHHSIDVEESNGNKETKRPICITFGSPLIGDEALQKAISERPQWESCFFNVVAKTDIVASFFSSDSNYKPFGTFVFCTKSGGHSAFEDHDAILTVLDAMASTRDENTEIFDNYGNILRSIRRKVLYRGMNELTDFNSNLLNSGIRFQLKEVGVLDNILNDQIKKSEDKQKIMIRKKRNIYEPTKKLNDMKIIMTCLEYYKKTTISKGGYYDSFKNAKSREEIVTKHNIVKHQRTLNQYWKWFVKYTETKPQKEDAKMRTRWLLTSHNYRRMFEPLDIAEFYLNGNRNYIANRSDHYLKLEKLLVEDKKETPSDGIKKAASLTKDSCFWAHVEEASITLKDLKNEGSNNNVTYIEQLEQFEVYMMNAINDFSVSPQIFLEGSSLMVWWTEYKMYRGSSYSSMFAEYMNNKSYELYQPY